MVGAMRQHAGDVARLLGLPSKVFVVYGMSIGWPADDQQAHGLKPRLPADLVIHHERYSDAGADAALAEYNRQLAEFYEARGRNLDPEAAWTGPVAARSRNLRYADLRSQLESLGFDFG